MLQRLATGSTGVEQARYRRSSTRGSEASHAHAQYIHSLSIGICIYHCVYGRSLALAVQCETTHGVYDFRRGFCTLVLFILCVCVSALAASASVETSKQRYSRVSLRLFLD